jgi:hypothetical protein
MFAGEKAEVRLMAVWAGKLAKSGWTSNGNHIVLYLHNKFNITSVFGLRKMQS